MPTNATRRLIVNADDFGRSPAINQAVIQAHREGILTTASLMVNGAAADQAVEWAHAHPTLGVGLHLSLVCARSTLKPTEIPGLVDESYHFSNSPVLAGIKYFVRPGLRWQLRHEIEGQFRKFRLTGLPLDHVNGHLHLHLHPTVFSLLAHHAVSWGIRRFRLTREPFWLNARLARGRWCYRASHALIFSWLAGRARPVLRQQGILHTSAVFGLLQNGQVDEDYLLHLLPRLPQGDSEVYSHPATGRAQTELDALLSERVKRLVADQAIQLIRYQDL